MTSKNLERYDIEGVESKNSALVESANYWMNEEESKLDAFMAKVNSNKNKEESGQRTIRSIAREIRRDWTNVNYAAKPYLDAMMGLDSIDDTYMNDSGRNIVAYFLSNSGQWKGDVAREIKKELKSLLKPARSRRSRR